MLFLLDGDEYGSIIDDLESRNLFKWIRLRSNDDDQLVTAVGD